MRRVLLGLFSYFEFISVVLLFLPLLALARLRGRDDPSNRLAGRMMRRLGRTAARLTPLWRFRVEGEPPADLDRRAYVVVSNHESTADPFLLSFLPWDMRWIGKEEIYRTPVTGWALRLGGDIAVRRGDGKSVREMMNACHETLAQGLPVMIFPEGTRTPDGRLLPFKDGAFQLAIEAGVPILPVAIAGTRRCRPKGSRWFGEAEAVARILAPIDTAGLTRADVERLREETRTAIAFAAGELRRSLAIEAPEPPATEPLEAPRLAPGGIAAAR